MKIIEHTPERLVIRELPILFWVNSAIFLFLGVLFLVDSSSTRIASALIAIGLLLVLLPSAKTFVIENTRQIFEIRWRSAVRRRSRAIPLTDIVNVEVFHPGLSKKISMLNLVLKDDKFLTLTDTTSRSSSMEQIADIMRSYIVR